MRFLKHILFSLIIFSNACFGKEFDKLFVVYEPVEIASQIEKSINNSFNTMVYRLSGSNSPSNIWKIINAGSSRKNFIKSYSIRNIDGSSFLEVNYDKDLLIETFNELSIPILSSSRPVILFLIEIDSGTDAPYYLTSSESYSEIDSSLKNFLKKESSSRGIFLELPEIDLMDEKELSNYERLIDFEDIINEKYTFDDLIKIKILNFDLITKGNINKKPKKNLMKPTLKTFASSCANFKNTLISTAQKEATKARIMPLTFLVIVKV